MATKTITIELDVYDRLVRARENPKESFSNVIRREVEDRRGMRSLELAAGVRSGTYPTEGKGSDVLEELHTLDAWFLPERFV